MAVDNPMTILHEDIVSESANGGTYGQGVFTRGYLIDLSDVGGSSAALDFIHSGTSDGGVNAV